MSTTYLGIKARTSDLFSKQYQFPEDSEDNFALKHLVEEMQNVARDLKHMYLETKIAYKTITEIPVPAIQRFSCIVDELMFKFKDMSKTQVIIQKVGPQTYKFGTKQI